MCQYIRFPMSLYIRLQNHFYDDLYRWALRARQDTGEALQPLLLEEYDRRQAKVNIDEAQRKDKLYYDRKHSGPKEFSPDTLVLLKNSQRKSKKGDKMKSRWLGPYLIHEVLGKGVYRLSNPETGVVLKTAVNQCRLKLYNEPPSSQ